jgi:hypothetical protein
MEIKTSCYNVGVVHKNTFKIREEICKLKIPVYGTDVAYPD